MSFPKTPALMTDSAVFDPDGRVLLIRRKHEPFAGCYALPGGFVDIGETVEAACLREVQEEAGIAHGRRSEHTPGLKAGSNIGAAEAAMKFLQLG